METFWLFFGNTYWNDNEDAGRDKKRDGLKYIDQVISIGTNIAQNVNNDEIELDVYCDDDWLKDESPSGRKMGAPYYFDGRTLHNDMAAWMDVYPICREEWIGPNLGDVGPSQMVAGLITNGDNWIGEVLMVCPVTLRSWPNSRQLGQDKETKFNFAERQLDDYFKTSYGRVLFHELTHSPAVMAMPENKRATDPKIPEGTVVAIGGEEIPPPEGKAKCYGFWGSQAVASQRNRENQDQAIWAAGKCITDLSKEKLLKRVFLKRIWLIMPPVSPPLLSAAVSADVQEFIALYLDKNSWGFGFSMDLLDPSKVLL
ncbi:hypothetical protein ACLMJK_003653 [Lecanora helva]